jgi:hypothetical protein
VLNTHYNFFQESLYSHGHKKKIPFSLSVDVCICLSVCLTVAIITRKEVMRRARNFGISFTKIVSCVVQDTGPHQNKINYVSVGIPASSFSYDIYQAVP